MADAEQDPLFARDLYSLHQYLVRLDNDCTQKRVTDPVQTCKRLWNARRLRNTALCEMDESGGAQGWAPAARMALVSIRVRETFGVRCTFLADQRVYSRWRTSLMMHSPAHITDYDVSDILLTMRTLARNWTNASFWKEDPRTVCDLLEMLLYDLNVRMEQCVVALRPEDELPVPSIRECVETTALLHCMIISFMARTQNCVPVSAIALAEWEYDRSTDWARDFADATPLVRNYIRSEYLAISGMGRLPENICKMLRALLMPLDIFARFKTLENIGTDSHVVASQRVLSIAELHWIENRMIALQPAELLDATTYRPDQAWLFEACCVLRTCDILFCQHNAGFAWLNECVLVDRDACSEATWKQAIARRPCIYIFGATFVLAWREHVFTSRCIYETILAWALIVRRMRNIVRVSAHKAYTLVKEITTLCDMSFPHLLD